MTRECLLALVVGMVCIGCVYAEPMVFQGLSMRPSYKDAVFSTVIIDEDAGEIYYDGDVVFSMQNCQEDGWYCISDGFIEFALPNGWGPENKSWNYRDIEYSIIESDMNLPFDYLGTTHLILREPDPIVRNNLDPMVFVYSMDFGIVGLVLKLANDERLVDAVYFRTNLSMVRDHE